MEKRNKQHDKRHLGAIDIGRGTINNYLAALVTSSVYKSQIIQSKKGKGSYQRKDKHKGRESYLMAA